MAMEMQQSTIENRSGEANRSVDLATHKNVKIILKRHDVHQEVYSKPHVGFQQGGWTSPDQCGYVLYCSSIYRAMHLYSGTRYYGLHGSTWSYGLVRVILIKQVFACHLCQMCHGGSMIRVSIPPMSHVTSLHAISRFW